MIKRIQFVRRGVGVHAERFALRWVQECARVRHVPAEVRPLRVVACVALDSLLQDPAPHDAVRMDWFAAETSLRAYERWWQANHKLHGQVLEQLAPEAMQEVVAEEHVLRGAQWLQQRWSDGAKFKHMALARRAHGLTPQEFADRWRAKAGKLQAPAAGGGRTLAPIPDTVKGCAYVQNHPLLGAQEWPYDAINEVYFEDLTALRARVDFFQQRDVAQSEAGLVREPRFMAVREHIVWQSPSQAESEVGVEPAGAVGA